MITTPTMTNKRPELFVTGLDVGVGVNIICAAVGFANRYTMTNKIAGAKEVSIRN